MFPTSFYLYQIKKNLKSYLIYSHEIFSIFIFFLTIQFDYLNENARLTQHLRLESFFVYMIYYYSNISHPLQLLYSRAILAYVHFFLNFEYKQKFI